MNTTSRPGTLILLAALLFGCVPPRGEFPVMPPSNQAPENSFTVAPQIPPSGDIRSIQFYRNEDPGSPPILQLGSSQQLTLEFDRLSNETSQFRASLTHYSRDWNESPLDPHFYIDGFTNQYFGGGLAGYPQNPSYRHYTYTLPNDRLSITASGNYLLAIEDADSGELLFSLPFLVTEEQGELVTRVETEYARRDDLREQDRLFSQYRYPDFVERPGFDLSFGYVPNQFWGRFRSVTNYDTSTPGSVHFHLASREAFPGDYEFLALNLRDFSPDGRQILSYDPATIPPTVILDRDIQRFSPLFPAEGSRFGSPANDRYGNYGDIHFSLETAIRDTLREIYLVGDFNGWHIETENRLRYDRQAGLWKGRALIKQGEYRYKYVVAEAGRIDDLELDRGFTALPQQYITLVYFRDPIRMHDRLLKVGITEQ